MRGLFLAALLSVSAHAQIVIDRFSGLDDTDAPAALQPYESQDLLNVESNLTGTAAVKRKGFSQEGSLTISTAPITGSHTFKDSSGNTVSLVFHDRYGSKSTNGGAFTNWLTTAPASITRWQCVDVGGKAYCVNDQRIAPLEYDGTTQRPPASMPQGAVIELCSDRLAIADISATPNRVAYSQSGVYTNFTTGSDTADPWTDDFGTPGDRVTALKCDQGRLYIFKTASIISCILGDQYTTKCFPVSNAVGTLDPLSIVGGPDGIYFKSQDKTFWRLNADGLTPISQKISNLVKSQASGSQQSNTQTSLADWQAGAQFPGGSWSTSAVAGSVQTFSTATIETSSASFARGTTDLVVITSTGDGEISPSLFSNSGFETGDLTGWTQGSSAFRVVLSSQCGPSSTGNFTWGGAYEGSAVNCGGNPSVVVEVIKASDGTVLYSTTHTFTSTTGCARQTVDVSTQNVYMKIRVLDGGQPARNAVSTSFSTAAVPGGIIDYGVGAAFNQALGISCGGGSNANHALVDFAYPYGTAFSTFTSQAFDTGLSTPTWGIFKATFTRTAGANVTFDIQASNDGTTWDTAVSVLSDGRPALAAKRKFRYHAYFTTNRSSVTATVNQVELGYATTGQYRTQAIQPGSNVGSWGILSCDTTLAGNGSLVFYATGAYSVAALSTMTPVEWPVQTNNATLGISVNVSSAVYIGWRSLLTSATDQAQVNACTLYWNNGTLPQPTWGVYDPIKNAAYWSLAINNAATNNRVLKYDLNLDAWYPFSLTATALDFVNSSVYFGSSSSATWNKYGGVDADNGGNINAYWKTKDFAGTSPFQETSWSAVSVVARNQVTGSMTGTYSMSNNNQTGSFTVSLGTTSTRTYVRSSYALPLASPANFINVKYGNDSTTPFEILGIRFDGVSQPWKPTTTP